MSAAASRQRRSTAGQRMTSLVGKALEEDETFWGHDTWAEGEDSGNESFHESDEDSALKKDEFDSDFDDSESDHEDEEREAGAEEEAEIRRSELSSKQRKNNYVDIAKAGRDLMAKKKLKGKKRLMGEGINAGIVLNLPVPDTPIVPNSETSLPPVQYPVSPSPPKKVVKATDGSNVKSSLASTRERRSLYSPRRLREVRSTAPSDLKRPGKNAQQKKSKRRRYAQEELIVEAVNETEPENERWLLARKRVQDREEKDKDTASIRNSGRAKIIQKYNSRRGCLITLTFPEMDAVPEILTRPNVAPTKPKAAFCVITGKRARYLDPLTNKGYYDIAAFKELRRRHRDGEALDQRGIMETEDPDSKLEAATGNDENAEDAHDNNILDEPKMSPSTEAQEPLIGSASLVRSVESTEATSQSTKEDSNSNDAGNVTITVHDNVPSLNGASTTLDESRTGMTRTTPELESPPVSPTRRASQRKWKPSSKLLENIALATEFAGLAGGHAINLSAISQVVPMPDKAVKRDCKKKPLAKTLTKMVEEDSTHISDPKSVAEEKKADSARVVQKLFKNTILVEGV